MNSATASEAPLAFADPAGPPRSLPDPGQRQRRHPPLDLARDPERRPAGGQDDDLGGGLKERLGRLRACLREVLAVVEHDEGFARGEVGAGRLELCHPGQRADPERRGDRRADEPLV